MTHEFKKIIEAYAKVFALGKQAVLATLVEVNGSSYRKEGVRMLVLENSETIGAVSGGCVEKEVVRQAQSVFKTGQSKLISYDGRYRLGCEGTLFLFLEKLSIAEEVLFKIQQSFIRRASFILTTFYGDVSSVGGGTTIQFNDERYPISDVHQKVNLPHLYSQTLQPVFQLYIIGTEYDAVSLSRQASFLGWEVIVVNTTKTIKSTDEFTGAKKIINTLENEDEELCIDAETAVVLMNHNYAKDLLFLKKLKNSRPIYIGLLGAKKRREQLLNTLIEEDLEVSETFLELIHGPTGLDIGAVTPQEIAVSIVSEIIMMTKNKALTHLQSNTVFKLCSVT
ncbi:hypothetical protein AXE80_13965 [Wenyingzhuangia fucanilytica]|uniref:XshC-Cox1-family protein n=1 Tax=Wenyingzhuangia fucanilytica TaxID=1790137 RepID=A0A1B1Y983_9FLAO|nr:XdhC/CoxI family protein [Wenyingzhuangia fucanilytica]ANW97332.1 hypothetical protein AXE80_13965 [Wenyingzhuangia fucanilytica]